MSRLCEIGGGAGKSADIAESDTSWTIQLLG